MNVSKIALDIVHQTLRDLHEQGVELHASAEVLARLARTRGAVGALSPASLAIREAAPEQPPRNAAARNSQPLPKPHPQHSEPAPMVESAPADVPAADVPQLVVHPVRAARALDASGGRRAERLAALRDPVLVCTKCPNLVTTRTQVVFGSGNPEAELMFIGEAPGEEDDLDGKPFSGPVGSLLTKIIEAMGYQRQDVYISHVVKCRPNVLGGEAGTRKPSAEEMHTCLPYLKQQIEIIQPRVLVALGATAMEGLIGQTQPMGRLRGRWHEFEGIPMMATYHPAYLLRNQALGEKRKVWEDMLLVLERLERPVSEKQRNFFRPKS